MFCLIIFKHEISHNNILDKIFFCLFCNYLVLTPCNVLIYARDFCLYIQCKVLKLYYPNYFTRCYSNDGPSMSHTNCIYTLFLLIHSSHHTCILFEKKGPGWLNELGSWIT